jgi:hypothetical protein
MSRRREANRAEAIVKAIGGLVMVLLLFVMVLALPHFLKGKDTRQMMDTMMYVIGGMVFLVGLITVIGLIVWFRVLKGKNKRQDF